MNGILHHIFRKLFPPSLSKMGKCLVKYKNSNCYPNVLSIDQTIELIKNNKMSLTRFGDGEFSLCFNKSIKFQKADKLLKLKLREILISNSKNCLISIPEFRTEKLTLYWTHFWYENIKKISTILAKDYCYGNAYVTREVSIQQINKLKEIWDDKIGVFIVGKDSHFEYIRELYGNMKKYYFIYGKSTDAWADYGRLINEINKIDYENNMIYLISLGPTATILTYELSKAGKQAIDIGHLSNIYNHLKYHKSLPEKI